MVLRAKKPEITEKRLKVFLYGKAKVGKTTASIQFERPYLIDAEAGATRKKYVDILNGKGGVVFETNDFEEIVTEVKALLTEKHEYKTLIIDPLTTIYNNLIDKCEEKYGTEYGKHYQMAGKKMKHLYNLLTRLDMNVVITSHAKNEYGDGMKVIDQTFDCYKKIDYLFDLILEIQKIGPDKNPKRQAIVKGSRLDGFPDGDRFEFSYDEIAKRYGKELLEREVVSEVLATEEQIKEIKRLIELLSVPAETCNKWLEKGKSETWEEMPADNIAKCIEYLQSKIKGE